MTIRAATSCDIPQLADLLSLLFAQEADFIPNIERQTCALRLILDHPEAGRIFCAENGEDGSIVGMVSLMFSISTAEGGAAAWLEDMIVLPEQRGRHIGAYLLKTAVNHAKAAGCTRISLLTDEDNQIALRFYQRAGFKDSKMRPLRLTLRD
ncbi:GNAT family N-acetyltransferase [Candidatus Methylospira mobilis]|uniref:GNAT family N-acetyltransferase n=1 Tax=Candidatus Methylospira mobilis TaxID=1808979 RepID=A0A5Q0BLV2_9GAMM|nr:GNAT family N-acetyltransferase [Candidatus Methylospira mobilis]